MIIERRKIDSDWADVTSSGRSFQIYRPATGKAMIQYGKVDCVISNQRGHVRGSYLAEGWVGAGSFDRANT
jgi:hypothetical protein